MKLVFCNAPVEQANALAQQMVDADLAACVTIFAPVTSIYRWQGERCEETEATLLLKVAEARVEALRTALIEAHPYEVPEVVCLAVDEAGSHAPYLAWVEGQ